MCGADAGNFVFPDESGVNADLSGSEQLHIGMEKKY